MKEIIISNTTEPFTDEYCGPASLQPVSETAVWSLELMDQGLIKSRGGSSDGFSVFLEMVQRHFRARPLRSHLVAWSAIAVAMALLTSPDFRVHNLIGFTVSGIVCCGFLGLLTWPFSVHYAITMGGAFFGWALLTPAIAAAAGGSIDLKIVGAVGLIAGSLFGATGIVWFVPLRWIVRQMKLKRTAG